MQTRTTTAGSLARARSRSRYPRSKQEEQGDRSKWPWLPGSIPRAWQNGPCCACSGGNSYVQGQKPG
jgi:hypothetical protein